MNNYSQKRASNLILERLLNGLARRNLIRCVNFISHNEFGCFCECSGVVFSCAIFEAELGQKKLDDHFDRLELFFEQIGEMPKQRRVK